MKVSDLEKMTGYLFNVGVEQFANDVYKCNPGGDYIREKYNKMQNNFIFWISSLDSLRLNNLITAINNYNG